MKYYVYILRSQKYSDKTYIGFTTDLEKRLAKHNEGGCNYTNSYKPLEVEISIAFNNKEKALAFEKYLKTHSGRAFTSKRLLSEAKKED